MLVISAANPATMNRRLDKLAAQFGLVKFGDDGAFTALATAAGPQTAVSIDKTVRRISFTNLGLSGTGAALNLNGTLEYTTNVDASNRAACG